MSENVALDLILRSGSTDILRDDFNGAAINTGVWTVTDTGSKLSVSAGKLASTGQTGTDDPRLTSVKSFANAPGLTYEQELTWSAFGASGGLDFGFDSTTPVADTLAPGFYLPTGGALTINGAVTNIALSTATSYRFRVVLLASGALWYYSTDSGLTWKALWHDTTALAATLYAGLSGLNANAQAWTSDYLRVFKRAAPSPVVSDTFTRADGAIGSAETGQLWTAFGAGAFNVVSNQAQPTGVGWPTGMTIDAGVSDGVAEVTYVTLARVPRLIFRFVDASNTFVVEPNAGAYTLYRRLAGVDSALGTGGSGGATNDVIRAVLVGSSIQVYQNNTRIINVTDTNFQTATKFGISAQTVGSPTHDNFAVWSGLSS